MACKSREDVRATGASGEWNKVQALEADDVLDI
jgi:hypothetical protein